MTHVRPTLCFLAATVFCSGASSPSSSTSTPSSTRPAMSASRKEEISKILNSRDLPGTNPRLVTFAILELRNAESDWAYLALADCLDWNDPITTSGSLPYLQEQYPAVASLTGIGKPCIPAVIAAISNGGKSETFKNNGLMVIFLTQGESSENTIKVLREFATKYEKAGKTEEAKRLSEIAIKIGAATQKTQVPGSARQPN